MEKTQEMNRFLDEVSMRIYGRKRSDCLEKEICVKCAKSSAIHRDKVSRQEWKVSGLCQNCQDEIFGYAKPTS